MQPKCPLTTAYLTESSVGESSCPNPDEKSRSSAYLLFVGRGGSQNES